MKQTDRKLKLSKYFLKQSGKILKFILKVLLTFLGHQYNRGRYTVQFKPYLCLGPKSTGTQRRGLTQEYFHSLIHFRYKY